MTFPFCGQAAIALLLAPAVELQLSLQPSPSQRAQTRWLVEGFR
jgi:hypothetical protein